MVGRPLARDPHFSSIFYQVRSGCSPGGLSQGSKPSKKVIPGMQVVFKSLFALGLLIFHWLEQVTWPTHTQRVMIQTSPLKGGSAMSQMTRGRICGHFNLKHDKNSKLWPFLFFFNFPKEEVNSPGITKHL